MKDRLGIHYDPIKDPRLFLENIARRRVARRREKEKRRKQKEKEKDREKAFRERVKKTIKEVGVELESTEEVEDSEEFIVLNNENKNINKLSKKKREKKEILIEKAEEQSEKDCTVVRRADNNNNNVSVVNNNNNNNNKSTNPIPLSNPKPKSLKSQLLTLTTTLGLVKKAKGLEEDIQLSDYSKQYFSFSGEVFKCSGYFSRDKIFEEVKPNLWWIILVGLFLAVIFTIVLNSYWPILLSIYKSLKDLLSKKEETTKKMTLTIAEAESVKDSPNDNSNKQLTKNNTQQLSQYKQKESWSIKDKFIVGWIIICFICTLIISIVIYILIITYIINSKDHNLL
jgi:hypothetical protein